MKKSFTEKALELSRKAKFNLSSIVIDYFSIIQKADIKIGILEIEIEKLKDDIERLQHKKRY